MMVKVLLDTDIGTDVDDAVCLAYLLAQPECKLLGITTVTGEAEKRASLASALCQFAGRDVPIYPGADQPLKGQQRQLIAHQATALQGWPHQTKFPQGEAINFLRRMIHTHPGEVTLLTIGPLTNIGQLFSEDPEVPRLLKALVMMGGVYNQESPEWERVEWNVCGDPDATQIVFRAPLRVHRALGLDITQQVVLPVEEVRARFSAPLLRPVLDFAEIWFAEFYPAITFHDPLAAATLFDQNLCAFEQGTVTIDMIEQPGRTYFQPGGPDSPHQIAVSVNPERYFEHFFSVLR